MPRAGASRPALDDAYGEHDVKVNVDYDVKDSKQLCQAIVKATGQMLGEISQQIVEFDSERKQADAESARRLLASTELIAKRLGTVEKEVLEGQRHMELMESLSVIVQMGKEPNHDSVLKAIAGIVLEPTDISPVLSEVSSIGKRHHGKLEELMKGMQDSHANLHGKHGDLMKNQGKLQELLLAIQESHNGLHGKHQKLLGSHGKIEEMLAALHDGHAQLHSKQAEVLGAHTGLRELLTKLQDGHSSLHDKNRDLLAAISAIVMPDLGPFHEHFSVVGDALSKHGTKVTSLEQRLSQLEKNDQDQKQLLETILKRLPLDMDKQLKGIQAEVKAVRAETQKDADALADVVQGEVRGLQKELQQLRAEVSNSSASAEKEMRKLQQALEGGKQHTTATMKQHSTDLLTALRQLEGVPELEAITGGVVERLKKVKLSTDHSPILAALECIPDLHQRMCHVHEKVSSSNVHYDPADVLKAISKIKSGPDHDTIAAAVHDRISRANLKFDTSELMRALGKIDLDKAFEAHSSIIDGKLRKHSGDILKAVGNMPDHDTIANAMHERLKTMTMNVDHGELKQMIRRIPTEHDHGALASAVHDRIGSALSNAGNHSKILSAISSLKIDPDLTIVLEAIEAMEESVVTTLLEAIRGIDMQVMCRGSMPASLQPRLENGSSKVRQAYGSRPKQLVAPPESTLALEPEPRPVNTRAARDRSTPATDASSPRVSKPKADRSVSAGPVASRASAPPPSALADYEAQTYESATWACICGFSCGTQAALERHLNRFAGQKGHRAVVS